MSQIQKALEALESAVIPLIRLGDFIGNYDQGGASGLGPFDRCAIVLKVRTTIEEIKQSIDEWNYHRDGEHPQFLKEDWRAEVAADDTILGYQEWVEHQVEAAEDEAEFAVREVRHE